MNLVPFNNDSNLPAYLLDAGDLLDINKEVVRAAAFPSLSIKGMKFTIIKDNVKKIVTKPDDDEEVAQSLGVVIVRANMNAKTFYAKKYVEGESDGVRPDCYSYDGVAPSSNAPNPQAKKCAACPNNVWGSRMGDGDRDGEEKKGKACNDNIRLAVSAPDVLDPMLLRVPPKSIKPLRETLKLISSRKVPYNAVVVKIAFNRDEPSPVLTFKPIGLVDDAGYRNIKEIYDGEVVRAIVGLDDNGHSDPVEADKPKVDADELDAALAARSVTNKAAAKSKVTTDDLDDELDAPAPKPKAEPKPEPKVEAAPKPKAEADEDDTPPAPKVSKGASNLLADLDDLLGGKDD